MGEKKIPSLTIRFAPVQAFPRSRVLLSLGFLPVIPRGRFLLGIPGRGRSVLLLLVTRLVHGWRVATLIRPRLRIVILGGHVVARWVKGLQIPVHQIAGGIVASATDRTVLLHFLVLPATPRASSGWRARRRLAFVAASWNNAQQELWKWITSYIFNKNIRSSQGVEKRKKKKKKVRGGRLKAWKSILDPRSFPVEYRWEIERSERLRLRDDSRKLEYTCIINSILPMKFFFKRFILGFWNGDHFPGNSFLPFSLRTMIEVVLFGECSWWRSHC